MTPAEESGTRATSGLAGGAGTAGTAGRPIIAESVANDRSAPLRTVPPIAPLPVERPGEAEGEGDEALPGREHLVRQPSRPVPDGVLQSSPVGTAVPALVANFEGIANLNAAIPPDANGDIGPNHYVEWVNLSFAVYSRTGTLLYGPAAGNTLWAGFGAPCQSTNDGDPIVQYDHLADRWLMSQFSQPSFPNGPFYQCVAVSQTGDPLGAWYRYAYLMSTTKLNDYPHFGVWPDGYYMSVNQFTGGHWAGEGVVAFDRAMMLAGQPASMVMFDLFSTDPNASGMLPADLDGAAPPAGRPNLFMEVDDAPWGFPQDQLRIWSFHVDWANPASSTFTQTATLATAPFDSDMCAGSASCIPQPGTTRGLDAVSDRLMYRLAYRSFGAYASLVVNHTVDVDGTDRAGIRWYELRDSGAGWNIRQQGTYSPDATDRWVASAAMDGDGNIAVAYSAASSSIYPSIRYTGRRAGDPLGSMTLGEGTIIAGSGAQLHAASRWGDYTMLAVDPVDDCTFWYAGQYVAVTGLATWQTRIAAFTLPGCGTSPTTGSIAGTVAEAGAGLPVAGATVTLDGGSSRVADPAGGYEFLRVAPGPHSVDVSAPGFVPVTVSATVASGLAASTDIALIPTDPRPAVLALTPMAVTPTREVAFTYLLTFSEAVTGLDASDISITGTSAGWSVASLTGSGAGPYTIAVAAPGPTAGTVILTLAAWSVTDAGSKTGPYADEPASTVTWSSSNLLRLSGAERYATAAAISAATFVPGVPVAYVATGTNFPDALAGSVAAAQAGGPILLVTSSTIPAATAAELTRLAPGRIVILGGSGVVGANVAAALAGYTAGTVTRLSGAERYATAAAISAATFVPGVPVAYVATGTNFPDALAGSVAAAQAGGPILLVTSSTIPAATAAELTRLAPGRIVILGGSGVVGANVAAALAGYTAGTVTRLSGAERYATAAAISAATFVPGVPVAYVATGTNFPDALAGSVAAAQAGGPILLVTSSTIPAATAAELTRLAPGRIVILGGSGVVGANVAAALAGHLPS